MQCSYIIIPNVTISPTGLDSFLSVTCAETERYLRDFALAIGCMEKMRQAFGEEFQIEIANQIITNWQASDFGIIPSLELLSSDQIVGAKGGFAVTKNRIYLSEQFVRTNYGNINVLSSVLLEEIGHKVDGALNAADTPGDEGEYFSNLVRNIKLDTHQIETLINENDISSIIFNGEEIQIEQSLYDITQFKQDFTAVFDRLEQHINITLGNKIPLLSNVDNRLISFIDDIKSEINLELSVLTEINSETLQRALFNSFDNLGILLDTNKDGTININDLTLITLPNNTYTFQAALGGDKTFGVSLLQDFGVSNLGLDLTGQVNIELYYQFNLGFGLELHTSQTPKFYLDTTSSKELSLEITASLENFNAQASLGLFALNVTDKNPQPELTGTINIDLQDTNNQLTLEETPVIVATFDDGEASLKLGLSAKINNTPVINADLNLDWTFAHPSFDQPVLGTVTTQVIFNNQTYDSVQALIEQIDYNVILSQGFATLLTLLKEQIISKLGNKIPLLGNIGNQLVSFIDDINNQVDLEFSKLTTGTIGAVRGALFNTFDNLGILLDTNKDGTININDLTLITLPNNTYTFRN